MIKQFLKRRAKIARGALNTYVRPRGQNYDPAEWWDSTFYTKGVSDRDTLMQRDPLTTRYHYSSVELQVLRHLRNSGFKVEGSAVLDIGSGSGHWIDFYRSLGSARSVGLDISLSSVNYLKEKYAAEPDIRILHGTASDVLTQLDASFNVVSAIGVMFHIVDDSEWLDTINKIAGVLQKDGLFIVGGHFGYLNRLNVQMRKGQINKRLRSKRHWTKALTAAGFSNVQVYSNNAYLWINDILPENNVLVAVK